MKNTIQVESVRISGFRGIQNMEINLPRIAVLIGPNNSGKTSVLKALQLALGNYTQYLSEEDFFIDEKDSRAEEIIIDIRIVPFDAVQSSVKQNFDEEWGALFSDRIKKEGDQEFLAIRTIVKTDEAKGGFECVRYILKNWPKFNSWKEEKPIPKEKSHPRLLGLSFISMESQRDIYHELRDKSSFAGRILADVKYDKPSTEKIEKEIETINQEAVKKSEGLKSLKTYLKRLSSMFYDESDVEISPFPKKIRDLSKHFSIYFGKKDKMAFSMEYHGMGTRSWASILTTLAFIQSRAKQHAKESKPFFPLFTAEEPEAHLHPSAQKTLCRQLEEFEGQAVITTHSPYFVATANISDIRSLSNSDNGVVARNPSKSFSSKEIHKINREIISHKGELLFAKAWILCEGITEEQLIPVMFELKNQETVFNLGISCVSVNGRNYSGFLKLAFSMGIPIHIISDNDNSTKKKVEDQINKLKNEIEAGEEFDQLISTSFLKDTNNFEKELLNEMNLKEEIIEALTLANPQHTQAKKKELESLENDKILDKMNKNKAQYAGFLADMIRKNPNKKKPEDMIPKAVEECFDKILEKIR